MIITGRSASSQSLLSRQRFSHPAQQRRIGPHALMRALASGALSAVLLGCSDGVSVPSVAVVTPPVGSSSISGFAATGRALPTGSPVAARCTSGSADTTTLGDGSFVLPTSGLQFPCLLRALHGTGESQQTLYSMATAAGTAHITPLTHAVVLADARSDPNALFANPSAPALDAMVARLVQVQTLLRQLLAQQGLSAALAAAPTDFFSGSFRPATSNTQGDAHDLLLDTVATHFGGTDALAHTVAIHQTFYVQGFSARVDWRKCLTQPSEATIGGKSGYAASGCDQDAVILTDVSAQALERARVLRFMPAPEQSPPFKECLFLPSIFATDNLPDRPSWKPDGELHYLTGWDTLLGTGVADWGNRGFNRMGGQRGVVFANGNAPGAEVFAVYENGGSSILHFAVGVGLEKIDMGSTLGTCAKPDAVVLPP